MENEKLVSAIITTHDRQELLVRAVESVFNQTYKNIELIVVDDASKERADNLLKGFDLNYIYIPKEESKGGNYARNKGILASKGKYCAFLDDDDYWLPEKIEKQIALIKEQGCELVYCGRKMEIVKKDSTSFYDSLPNPSFWGDMSKKILLTSCCCTTSTMLISHQALLDTEMFDEKLSFWQDYELTIRLAQRGPFYFVNEALCVYRKDVNDVQRLTNKYFGWKKSVNYIRQKHSSLYKRLSLKEKIHTNAIVWEDACTNRCKQAGLLGRYYFYKLLLYLFYYFPGRIKTFLRRT